MSKKTKDNLLKEAFKTALKQEMAEIEPVGDSHEFSPLFEKTMNETIEKSKTVKFKLSTPYVQRYIAAGIAALFLISTFTVAAKITPPKTNRKKPEISSHNKVETTSSSEKITESEITKKPESTTSKPYENSAPSYSRPNPSNNSSSSIDNIEPWEGEEPSQEPEISAEEYVSSYQSVAENENDDDFVFHCNDKLYQRWNDLILCGITEKAVSVSVNLSEHTYNYLAVPLLEYPYAEAITSLKGDALNLPITGLEECVSYGISYRGDFQYLILETGTGFYLAKYLNSADNSPFETILETIYGITNSDSLTQAIMLSINDTHTGKNNFTAEEIKALYELLCHSIVTADSSIKPADPTEKLIFTTHYGGTIHIYIHDGDGLSVTDPSGCNFITLTPAEAQTLKSLLGFSETPDSATTEPTEGTNSPPTKDNPAYTITTKAD